MRRPSCHRTWPREAFGQLTPGQAPDPELVEHAETCPACADELRVAGWLRGVARAADGEPATLPSASQLWWKARILRELAERERLVERAVRPVRWSQWAGLGVASLVMALALVWAGGHLADGQALDAWLGALEGRHLLTALLAASTALPAAGFGVLWMLVRDP